MTPSEELWTLYTFHVYDFITPKRQVPTPEIQVLQYLPTHSCLRYIIWLDFKFIWPLRHIFTLSSKKFVSPCTDFFFLLFHRLRNIIMTHSVVLWSSHMDLTQHTTVLSQFPRPFFLSHFKAIYFSSFPQKCMKERTKSKVRKYVFTTAKLYHCHSSYSWSEM